MRVANVLISVAGIFTIACATSYQPVTNSGGYREVLIGTNTYRVEFEGNRYTSLEKARTFVLYRCAELTVENGFDSFLVVDTAEKKAGEPLTRDERYEEVSSVRMSEVNKCATPAVLRDSELRPASTVVVKHPVARAVIKMIAGPPPSGDPKAHDARRVMAELHVK